MVQCHKPIVHTSGIAMNEFLNKEMLWVHMQMNLQMHCTKYFNYKLFEKIYECSVFLEQDFKKQKGSK